MHYCLPMRIYRRFFINWFLANLIHCYKRAFTLWMCIISKIYGAKYIAFICLVGPDSAFESCAELNTSASSNMLTLE